MQDSRGNDQEKLAKQLLDEVVELALRLQPRLASTRRANLDSLLDKDLGFDSLGRLELITHLEQRFSVSLPTRAFAEAETPRDLLRALFTARKAGPAELTRIDAARLQTFASSSVELPDQAQTLTQMLDWHAQRQPDFPHIHLLDDSGEENKIISYAQLRAHALSLASGLQQHGLQAGDTVALMLPTGPDYFYSFFGVLYAGGIPVPIYPPARPTQLEDHMRRQAGILENARCSFLITVAQAKSLALVLKSQISSLRGLFSVDDLSIDTAGFSPPVLSAGDTAFLQYTSGSTGNPKGVILSHANLLTNIRVDGQAIEADGKDVFISWLPLYHDMGLIGAWLGSLYFGVQLIIMSPLTFLARPVRWLQALQRYGGTLSAAPNFAYELCLTRIIDDELKGLDLSSWRIAMNGAEAVSPDTLSRFQQRFGPYGFRPETMFPVYGLAESSVGLAFPNLGRAPKIDRIQRSQFSQSGRAIPALTDEDKALSFVGCGFALPGHEIRILDDGGHELPERREGRLQFRGPSSTSGYFRNPEASRNLFDHGWLESGDLAYLAEGEIFITGRSKDLIIRGGRNIYPHEIEELVGDIQGIRKGRVAVFASQDQKHQTEHLVVLAETHETNPETRATIQQEIAELTTELSMTPADDIVLAPPGTVLKTSSGKIRRAACRKLYEQGRIGKKQRAVWLQLLRMELTALPKQLSRLWQRLKDIFYAVYAWMVFHLAAIGIALWVLLMPIKKWRRRLLRPTAKLTAWLCGIKLVTLGKEKLPSAQQPCIYVVNHASYIDSYIVAAALPRSYRFMAKAELQKSWLSRTFLNRIGTLFIERFDRGKSIEVLQDAVDTLISGDSLLIYPEGTFTRAAGLRPFHMGAFVTAVSSRCPVVPVAIRGSRAILPGDSRFAHRGNITVTIGETIFPESLKQEGESDWDLALKIKEKTREQILRHCGEPDMGGETVSASE